MTAERFAWDDADDVEHRAAGDVAERNAAAIRALDARISALRLRTPGAPPVRRPARVLVVDDNPTICDALRILLKTEFDAGVEVQTVPGGLQALDCAAWRPDLVVLDWQMPGMDGPTTARHLRALLPKARILLYSAAVAGADSKAVAAGADRFLEKGADVGALLDEVGAAVKTVQAQRGW